MRIRESVTTVTKVWHRAFFDGVLSPRRFRGTMPELRRVTDMLYHPGVGAMPISALPPVSEPVSMLNLDPKYGGMPPEDLYTLLRVVRWLRPARIFEIGTYNGVTTAHLLANSAADIYTLDLPRDVATDLKGYPENDAALLQSRDQIGSAYRLFETRSRVHQLYGDSRTFDYTPFLGSMDLILVDACHLFEYVISDSEKALALLKGRGVILWHDFGSCQDVNRALGIVGKHWPIYHLEGTHLAIYFRELSVDGSSEPNNSGR